MERSDLEKENEIQYPPTRLERHKTPPDDEDEVVTGKVCGNRTT